MYNLLWLLCGLLRRHDDIKLVALVCNVCGTVAYFPIIFWHNIDTFIRENKYVRHNMTTIEEIGVASFET